MEIEPGKVPLSRPMELLPFVYTRPPATSHQTWSDPFSLMNISQGYMTAP